MTTRLQDDDIEALFAGGEDPLVADLVVDEDDLPVDIFETPFHSELPVGEDDEDVDVSSLLDEDESFGAEDVALSRRALSRRARRQMRGECSPSEQYGNGYCEGYKQALVDHVGLDADAAHEAFGRDPGVVRLVSRGMGKMVRSFVDGASGGKKPTDMARDAGKQVGQVITDAPVVADSSELPPTYVAEPDADGFAHELALSGEDPSSLDAYGGLAVYDRHGPSADHGFVRSQRRTPARLAAQRSLVHGSTQIERAAHARGNASAFLEDPECEPLMYGDGSIRDRVHGRLCAVPCPSCASVSAKDAQYGAATECLVCEGFGAVLIPSSDVEHFATARYGFFFVPLLLAGAVKALRNGQHQDEEQFGKVKLFPKAIEKLKTLFAKKKEQKALDAHIDAAASTSATTDPSDLSSLDTDVDTDLASLDESMKGLDSYGLVRAMVPQDMWRRMSHG